MNDPHLTVAKLRELLDQSVQVNTLLEQAAIFSAARILLADLHIESNEHRLGLGENIGRAQESFSAILGFDDGRGHPDDQHLIWGRQALKVIKEILPVNER